MSKHHVNCAIVRFGNIRAWCDCGVEKMTEDDKTLVKWLREEADFAYERAEQDALTNAADRIEAQAAEIERLHILLSLQPSNPIAPDPLLGWVIK